MKRRQLQILMLLFAFLLSGAVAIHASTAKRIGREIAREWKDTERMIKGSHVSVVDGLKKVQRFTTGQEDPAKVASSMPKGAIVADISNRKGRKCYYSVSAKQNQVIVRKGTKISQARVHRIINACAEDLKNK